MVEVMDMRNRETTFGNLINGDCFLYDANLFMQTGNNEAVNLRDGATVYFDWSTPILPVDITIQINS